ncbi:hypothetical protein [Granulicella sp. dw_53]|uniref:hypothetical protein n=1 Tax=Granulicella sp. dw_53 TaxID=2719792 RepID=UPI001BD4685B|nr:hypothetical protein [Granulicella sp. dw_53]
MGFNITDSTAGTQRLAIDYSANVEVGPATPSAPLSVGGRATLNGANLAQSIVLPPGLPRITGSVFVSPGSEIGVFAPTAAGFGSVSNGGGGGVGRFTPDKTIFYVYSFDPHLTGVTVTYTVF